MPGRTGLKFIDPISEWGMRIAELDLRLEEEWKINSEFQNPNLEEKDKNEKDIAAYLRWTDVLLCLKPRSGGLPMGG